MIEYQLPLIKINKVFKPVRWEMYLSSNLSTEEKEHQFDVW